MFYLLNYKNLILFKVSYNQIQPIKQLVIPLGFEPRTYSLEDCYSVQLSYGTIKISLLSQAMILITIHQLTN